MVLFGGYQVVFVVFQDENMGYIRYRFLLEILVENIKFLVGGQGGFWFGLVFVVVCGFRCFIGEGLKCIVKSIEYFQLQLEVVQGFRQVISNLYIVGRVFFKAVYWFIWQVGKVVDGRFWFEKVGVLYDIVFNLLQGGQFVKDLKGMA